MGGEYGETATVGQVSQESHISIELLHVVNFPITTITLIPSHTKNTFKSNPNQTPCHHHNHQNEVHPSHLHPGPRRHPLPRCPYRRRKQQQRLNLRRPSHPQVQLNPIQHPDRQRHKLLPQQRQRRHLHTPHHFQLGRTRQHHFPRRRRHFVSVHSRSWWPAGLC